MIGINLSGLTFGGFRFSVNRDHWNAAMIAHARQNTTFLNKCGVRGTVELPDGRKVRLTGRVDRIDVSPSGGLVVIDYKTGRFDDFKGLGEGVLLLHTGGGKKAKEAAYPKNITNPKLQLPLYARAVRSIFSKSEGFNSGSKVVSAYWFVSGRENFRLLSLEIDEALETEFARLLGLILDGIEGGIFPPRPTGGSRDRCEFCKASPDHGESDRRFRRKAFSPELGVLRALVEGESLEESP